MPPCKHYVNADAILKDASDIVNEPEFKKVIPPHKRENLLAMLKKQAQHLRRLNDDSTIAY